MDHCRRLPTSAPVKCVSSREWWLQGLRFRVVVGGMCLRGPLPQDLHQGRPPTAVVGFRLWWSGHRSRQLMSISYRSLPMGALSWFSCLGRREHGSFVG